MKTYIKVRGSMEIVPPIEVNIDTVYIRSNILRIDEVDVDMMKGFKGWEYDEIQYDKNEYIENMSIRQEMLENALNAVLNS